LKENQKKSGIFKKDTIALSVPQKEEPLKVLKQRAIDLSGHELISVSFDEKYFENQNAQLSLDGDYQKINAALAIYLSKIWLERKNEKEIHEALLKNNKYLEKQPLPKPFIEGLANCEWPGRSQLMHLNENVHLYMDGAHTIESIQECSHWFDQKMVNSPDSLKVLLFNCNINKDPKSLLGEVYHHFEGNYFDLVIFTTNKSPIVSILEDKRPMLSSHFVPENRENEFQIFQEKVWLQFFPSSSSDKSKNTIVADSIPQAFEKIFEFQKKSGKQVSVLATGSLYLVGAILETTNDKNIDKF